MKNKIELYDEIVTLIDKDEIKKGEHGIVILTPLYKEDVYCVEFKINSITFIKTFNVKEIELFIKK